MLAKGITYPFLSEVLKDLFVEVAENEFKMDKRPLTDSHLSLITGIHRKDIKRLRHDEHSETEIIPQTISLGARLVSRWTSDARFLDENNQPKPLPRFAREGGDISFEGLVAKCAAMVKTTARARLLRGTVTAPSWKTLKERGAAWGRKAARGCRPLLHRRVASGP